MTPYQQEFDWIRDSRKARLDSVPAGPTQKSLIGLAFSGGGIRSATFNLGVLQGLAKSKLLHKIDYLSSVSGGGYISSWLLGWMHHRSVGAREVEQQLKTEQATLATVSEVPEIRFLRNFSNYLTPRKGPFSGDLWAFLAVYFRNTLLNLLILLAALLSVLFAPRVVVWIFHAVEMIESVVRNLRSSHYAPWFLTSQGSPSISASSLASGQSVRSASIWPGSSQMQTRLTPRRTKNSAARGAFGCSSFFP